MVDPAHSAGDGPQPDPPGPADGGLEGKGPAVRRPDGRDDATRRHLCRRGAHGLAIGPQGRGHQPAAADPRHPGPVGGQGRTPALGQATGRALRRQQPDPPVTQLAPARGIAHPAPVPGQPASVRRDRQGLDRHAVIGLRCAHPLRAIVGPLGHEQLRGGPVLVDPPHPVGIPGPHGLGGVAPAVEDALRHRRRGQAGAEKGKKLEGELCCPHGLRLAWACAPRRAGFPAAGGRAPTAR